MNYSLQGSSAHGILQARILEWVATTPFSQRVGHDLVTEQQHVQFQSPMLLLSFGHNYACLQGEVVRESIGVPLDSFLRKIISLLVVPHSMWEASSMTRTQTHILCIGSAEA